MSMEFKRSLFNVIVLMLITTLVSAHHKPGHNPGSGCYAGGNGKKQGQVDCPLTVINVSDLQFPSAIAGYSQIVTVMPSDMGAAVFSLQGEPCSTVRVSVVESVDTLVANEGSSGDTITVRDFTYGGSVDSTGAGILGCSSGELNNIRVGGSVEVNGSDSASSYRGSLTLRALYY